MRRFGRQQKSFHFHARRAPQVARALRPWEHRQRVARVYNLLAAALRRHSALACAGAIWRDKPLQLRSARKHRHANRLTPPHNRLNRNCSDGNIGATADSQRHCDGPAHWRIRRAAGRRGCIRLAASRRLCMCTGRCSSVNTLVTRAGAAGGQADQRVCAVLHAAGRAAAPAQHHARPGL